MRIVFFVCTLNFMLLNCSDPLDGHYAKDPLISFQKVQMVYIPALNDSVPEFPIIHSYNGEREIFVTVSEYHRSDGKPVPVEGKDLYVQLESVHGEREIFSLDSPPPDQIRWSDAITPFFKFLSPQVHNTITPMNNILEFNSQGDTVTVYYSSYWHGHVVSTQITYNP
ncbi:MAG: hypothetical protein D6813_09330 [Calditrichaeota bacterium]|nr:MAG: hypothetical protein D6813_09330 [Calditrichota bacterium]